MQNFYPSIAPLYINPLCSYHPKSNGMIERQHRMIKVAIMARKQNWLKALPIVLLGMRNVPNESGFTPSTAVTGTTLLI